MQVKLGSIQEGFKQNGEAFIHVKALTQIILLKTALFDLGLVF